MGGGSEVGTRRKVQDDGHGGSRRCPVRPLEGCQPLSRWSAGLASDPPLPGPSRRRYPIDSCTCSALLLIKALRRGMAAACTTSLRGLAGRAAIILFFQTACAASSAAPRFCGAAALNCCTMLRLDASHWHCSAVLQSRPCTQSAQLPTSGRHGRSRPVADRSRAQQRMRATTEMRPLAYGPCDAANGDAHSTSRDSSFRKGPFDLLSPMLVTPLLEAKRLTNVHAECRTFRWRAKGGALAATPNREGRSSRGLTPPSPLTLR